MTTFKRQLQWTVAIIVTLALVLSSVLHAYFATERSRENALSALQSQLNVVAYNLVPALYFSDSDESLAILAGLQIQENILGTGLYLDGTLELPVDQPFAETGVRLLRPHLGDNRYQVARGLVFSLTPIVSEGERLGYLYVEARVPQLSDIIFDTLKLAAIVVLICTMVAAALTTFLSKGLASPITELVRVADKIVNNKHWSLRAPETEYLELQQLGHSFNRVLDSIEQEVVDRKQRQRELDNLNRTLEEKVVQRTLALEQKNAELEGTLQALERSQQQLVQREKMAGLGELVAGVAHEINTPVGISITATSHVMDNTRQLRKMFAENTLTRTQFSDYMDLVYESGEIALRNLERAAELVHSFKLVAVDQSSEESRRFNLLAYMEEVIASLRPRLKNTQHKIVLEGDSDIEFYGQPGMFAQLLTNLIMNSLLHGFEAQTEGRIEIALQRLPDRPDVNDENSTVHWAKICFSDSGKGVDDTVMARLFDPFFTTKRHSGGSGLGTHIIFNLVTHGLKGTISASNGKLNGLSYEIEFPLQEAKPFADQTRH
ncbi:MULTISPECIES: ATP-binding protein [Corallincola]|uniref:histidine kinase n=2 Tax=Corallincola TaxID=1775176 RepID=A0ABY1WNM5_9GAMM|nr:MULTISPECIES: ATP-binding protein [Corallincola]TAA45046.1 HAMP domain-containing protein [Corallincola spongiicola]TCI03674.1 HAMP domain-containing protein [Corallincola luteus]